MNKYLITFNKLYTAKPEDAAPTKEVIAASFKPVPGSNYCVFYDENGHAIFMYSNLDSVVQILG